MVEQAGVHWSVPPLTVLRCMWPSDSDHRLDLYCPSVGWLLLTLASDWSIVGPGCMWSSLRWFRRPGLKRKPHVRGKKVPLHGHMGTPLRQWSWQLQWPQLSPACTIGVVTSYMSRGIDPGKVQSCHIESVTHI